MKALYCQYCGALLDDNCDCEREIAEEREQRMQDYYDSPETQAGWANQDLIELGHLHQR